MIIYKSAYNIINNLITDEPPETGGILGSNDGNIITNVIVDRNMEASIKRCIYSPNVDFLNECIATWAEENIVFMGIFHTHFMGVETLSDADKKYIHEIMEAMPKEIESLFFPVFVLPNRILACYKVERRCIMEIKRDNLKII